MRSGPADGPGMSDGCGETAQSERFLGGPLLTRNELREKNRSDLSGLAKADSERRVTRTDPRKVCGCDSRLRDKSKILPREEIAHGWVGLRNWFFVIHRKEGEYIFESLVTVRGCQTRVRVTFSESSSSTQDGESERHYGNRHVDLARFRPSGRDLRVAAVDEAEDDVGGGDPFAGGRDRGMHVRVPAD